jgi:hypothetical protein
MSKRSKTPKAIFIAPLCALNLALLCGCEALDGLPDGRPPVGDIVEEIKNDAKLPSPDAAVNQIAMKLTMKLAAKRPKLELKAVADHEMGEELLNSLRKSKVVDDPARPRPGAPAWTLESALSGRVWTVKVVDADGIPAWAESVEIDTSSLEAAQ